MMKSKTWGEEYMLKKGNRLYLAHHLTKRKEIREWELDFEKKYGIQLINPFYDTENRKDIKMIDQMRDGSQKQLNYLKTRSDADCNWVVELDLSLIRKSDGILAFVEKSIGTSMEIIMAYRVFKIPVYVITHEHAHHAWIRSNSTEIFKDKEEFEKWVEYAVYRK